jgi:hypothetical protein
MCERQPSDRASQATFELTRLTEVEGFIQRKAGQLANDDPMLAEDLAQEAREAVIRRLREYPDCPYSHLVNKARDAIFRYRQKGSSVDGLLYQRGRARQYQMTSFEAPLDKAAGPLEAGPSLGEVLSDPAQPSRFTEERAIREVLLEIVRAQLSAAGNDALTLRLGGATWKEIRKALNVSHRQMGVIKKDVAQAFQKVWGQNL